MPGDDDRHMSRITQLSRTLICTLAIGLPLSHCTLLAQSVGKFNEVINIDDWDCGRYSLASAPDDIALSNFETSTGVGDIGYDSTSRGMIGEQRADSPDRLIDRVIDPTSWLLNFRFRESWNWPASGAEDSEQFQFRPTIPFRVWNHVNIMRVTVPYTVNGPRSGLGDVEILDLVVHEVSWGRWGVGPVAQLTSDDGSNSESFQLGPAAGVTSKSKHWTVGFLTQNFFAEDVAESRIQPILAYKINDTLAVGVGDFEFRYDWQDAEWTQLPLGVEVDYIMDLYGQKIQFFVNPQYNFERDASNSDWTLFLGLSILVPEA